MSRSQAQETAQRHPGGELRSLSASHEELEDRCLELTCQSSMLQEEVGCSATHLSQQASKQEGHAISMSAVSCTSIIRSIL